MEDIVSEEEEETAEDEMKLGIEMVSYKFENYKNRAENVFVNHQK